VIYAAFGAAERFGISVEHAAELNFAIFNAAIFTNYVISADIRTQTNAQIECYRAAASKQK
jgi:hypothetical protein